MKLRLLHVTPTYWPATRYGGPIVSVHGLCKALAARGHDVHVFTTDVDGAGVSGAPTGRVVDLDGVKVRYFPAGLGRRLYRSPAMGAALAREAAGFDVLHLHSVFLWPTAAAARAARRAQRPYLLAPRGMLVETLIRRRSFLAKRAWIALVERANLGRAAAIHATTDAEAEDYRRLRLPARRIAVLANGVEPPPPAPIGSRARPRLGPPRVLALGRLSWKKGLDALVAAMTALPRAELILAGPDDEGLRPRLETLARALGVAARVTFPGPVEGEAKWALLRGCDVFAMPSASENFGLAALEAMACARAVVVAPGVGLARAIREGRAGVVAEPNPRALAAAIGDLLADPDLRERLGRRAARLAAQDFGWDGVARQAEALYADVIGT